MTKNNNNQSSFSDQSKSRDEISNEKDNNDNSSISVDEEKKKKITENKNKSESLSASDYNNDINNKYDYEMDSNLDENDKSRENFKYDNRNLNINEREKQIMKLNFFDVNQFLNLDLDEEYKCLLTIMKKFEIDKTILTLDTKMKPYIPNLIPSIGEVDAFIKINRPDNKIEELGLDIVDEPTINGIDPSVFCLELSYKMKTKIPENFIIKSIENVQKNPKQITNWIKNLENLHKGANNNVTYTKKMPDIEQLMQV
jgi:intraflagellar transport protein 46